MTIHARVVATARSWMGTRFHHQGRLKKTNAHKGGVDCLGLVVGVASELQLQLSDNTPLTQFDETDYSHYPNSQHLREKLAKVLSPIPIAEIQPGDVILLNIDNNPQHLAIVSDRDGGYGIIHAYAPARAVVEHILDDWWHTHIVSAYRVKVTGF
jgi:cell wall-associated NlpC family hydrolase